MTIPQEIRREVLLQCYGAQRLTHSPESLFRGVQRAGLDVATKSDVLDAIFFLRGQGFIAGVTDTATGAIRYQITSAGTLHYEEQSSQL